MKKITQEQIDHIGDRRVVVSISGGKDSAALSLWLHENNIDHDRIFADTGWEHPLTYEYLRGPLTKKIGPITELRGPLLMQDLILKKGMFPSRKIRFCTSELKVKPIVAYFEKRLEEGVDCTNAIGIRAEESKERAKMPEWDWPLEIVETWRPLLKWSFEDVAEIHRRHDLLPNPLYFQGASRVGCWPCINAKKQEVRLIANLDPQRIDAIRDLEALVSEAANLRSINKGKGELDNDPSWFQARTGRSGACWPIDKVVAWAKTERGGKQYGIELFHAPQEAGCVRWGMCEASQD